MQNSASPLLRESLRNATPLCRHSKARLLLLVAALTSLGVLVQVPVAAGVIEPLRQFVALLPTALQGDAASTCVPQPATRSRGKLVSVVQFRFTGNTLFASKVLAAVLQDDLNRSLDYQELHALADKVSRFYRANGALALVVLPAQDISANKVIFVVIEAIPGHLAPEARLEMHVPTKRLA